MKKNIVIAAAGVFAVAMGAFSAGAVSAGGPAESFYQDVKNLRHAILNNPVVPLRDVVHLEHNFNISTPEMETDQEKIQYLLDKVEEQALVIEVLKENSNNYATYISQNHDVLKQSQWTGRLFTKDHLDNNEKPANY